MARIHQLAATHPQVREQGLNPDARSRDFGGTPDSEWVAGFVGLLDRSGLHDALRHLNGRARFRYTGLYRFERPVLIIESLYDRENPSLQHCGEIRQLEGTFCSIVLATGRPFVTAHASADPLLEKYSARQIANSYSGVPIRTRGGLVAGVLCHYDFRPRLLPLGELQIMEAVTPHLAPYLEIPRAVAGAPGDTR